MGARILLIAREPLVVGRENVYRDIEEETTGLSARIGCPHPYLAEVLLLSNVSAYPSLVRRDSNSYASSKRLSRQTRFELRLFLVAPRMIAFR
jgi:hypothetical protein